MQATPCPIHLPSRLASPHPRLQSQVVQSPNPSKKYAEIHRNNVKNYADNSDAKKIPTWPESEDDEEEDPSEDEEEDLLLMMRRRIVMRGARGAPAGRRQRAGPKNG